MVSNVKYYSFKDFDAKSKVPHLTILGVVLVFAFIQVDPPKVLFAIFLIYALSGPFCWLKDRKKNLKKQSNNNEKASKDDIPTDKT
jgi:CDP-diacylglycerol--serine O-phosphatidyltransferase